MAVVATLTTTRNRLAQRLRPAVIQRNFKARTSTTPGRLTFFMTVVGVVAVLAGLAATIGAAQRANQVEQVRNTSGPLTGQAQQLYRSLSDADATAAAAFLSSGAEPAPLRARYQADIAAAGAALAAAGDAGGTDVDEIAQTLPVYTGLVETARTYNRLNLPVAGAYLREASSLMRDRLLPAAQRLRVADNDALASDRGGATALPWLAILLILLSIAGLLLIQRFLVQRTHRLINIGLVSATAAGVVALIWLLASWGGVVANLNASRDEGSDQVALIADIRVAALTARADEALTLVARGSGGGAETDFSNGMKALTGSGGAMDRALSSVSDPVVEQSLRNASSALKDWQDKHTKLRQLDDGGQYPQAVLLAIGDPAKGGNDPASTASAFNRVDENLATAIARAEATFDDRARSADNATTAAAVGLAVLIVILLAGLIVGLQQRIAEYR